MADESTPLDSAGSGCEAEGPPILPLEAEVEEAHARGWWNEWQDERASLDPRHWGLRVCQLSRIAQISDLDAWHSMAPDVARQLLRRRQTTLGQVAVPLGLESALVVI